MTVCHEFSTGTGEIKIRFQDIIGKFSWDQLVGLVMVPQPPKVKSAPLASISPVKINGKMREAHFDAVTVRLDFDANAFATLEKIEFVTHVRPIKIRFGQRKLKSLAEGEQSQVLCITELCDQMCESWVHVSGFQFFFRQSSSRFASVSAVTDSVMPSMRVFFLPKVVSARTR